MRITITWSTLTADCATHGLVGRGQALDFDGDAPFMPSRMARVGMFRPDYSPVIAGEGGPEIASGNGVTWYMLWPGSLAPCPACGEPAAITKEAVQRWESDGHTWVAESVS